MKINANLVWIAAAAFAVAAGAQTSTGAGEYSSATAQAGQASASAAQAADVSAQLSKKIDSKDAKVGDEVVAKTTSDARLADGTKLPKGSRLVGHVTEAEAKSHDNRDAHLAFAFDHAVTKDGREVPIHAMMRSISVPAPMAAAGGSDDLFAGGMQGGGGAGGGARGGSGLAANGGGSGVATGAVRQVGGAAAPVTTAAAGGLNNETSGVDGAATSTLGATSNVGPVNSTAGVSGGAISGRAMPVGNLSGVTFATVNAASGASANGANASAGTSTATLITGHGRNVSLDSGAQMTLGVAPQ